MDAEAIVVGAGPAGSAAAYYLARRGRRVLLLERQAFPREKSCGDGITRAAARLLAEMGVPPSLGEVQTVRGVRVFMREKGSRDFEYPPGLGEIDHGLVVPRLELDHAICRQAVAAGAELWQEARVTRLAWSDGAVVGVEAIHRDEPKSLRAPVVVAADGAASPLARQAGLLDSSPEKFGFAIRGYYEGVQGLGDRLEIYTPLTDPTDRYLLPSYGWVFPVGAQQANIGVGLFQRRSDVNVRQLFERFLEELRRGDPRFSSARLRGEWKGAPIRFDFSPERSLAPGLLLVGDAAGMISPFTGEGISYALESGKLAAEVIDRNLRPAATQTPDLSEYALLLEKNYTGYFELGRQSARRYLLVWHVLESTFHNERPLFALCRRAVLFPEGIGESYTSHALDDVGALMPRAGLRLREDLLEIGEALLEVVRKDWPFLARVSAVGRGDPGIPFRPALLLLLAGCFGDALHPARIPLGAAVELGYLAALAHVSVEEEPNGNAASGESRPANWGNMLAVMLGDFLLSKAYQIGAGAGAAASRMIAEALGRVCEGQARLLRRDAAPEWSEAEHLRTLSLRVATLFELPCRLGAWLSGAPAAHADLLAEYGRNLGLAYQLTEEALAFNGRESEYLRLISAEPSGGAGSFPILRASHRNGPLAGRLRALLGNRQAGRPDAATLRWLVLESGAVQETLQLAREHARRAQAALEALPESPARLALARLADYAASRRIPPGLDLKAALQEEGR